MDNASYIEQRGSLCAQIQDAVLRMQTSSMVFSICFVCLFVRSFGSLWAASDWPATATARLTHWVNGNELELTLQVQEVSRMSKHVTSGAHVFSIPFSDASSFPPHSRA